MSRLFLYPKDIMGLMGKSERQARRIHLHIRRQVGKGTHELLTVEEFCQYYHLNLASVLSQLR